MLRVHTEKLLFAYHLINQLHYAGITPDLRINDPEIDILSGQLDQVVELLKSLDLEFSAKKADQIRISFQTTKSLITLKNCSDLSSRIYDEVEGRYFLMLTPSEQTIYDQPHSTFSGEIFVKFPETIEDISEAGKCLALGRSTACVFHLMRAMERVVQQLCSFLNITNIDRDWGKLLSDIQSKIQNMEKGSARDEWSESSALLYNVKQAWRNSTMHPKQTYTAEEAQSVLNATKSFMFQLSRLL